MRRSAAAEREPLLAGPLVEERTPPATDRRPEILYVAHRLPYPPDKGDRIRSFHLLEWLSGRASVHLACFADEPIAPGTEAVLRGLCRRIAIIPLAGRSRWLRALASLAGGRTVTEGAFRSPAMRACLRDWTRETRYHAAVGSASSVVQYLKIDGLRDVPALIDLVDVDSQKWFDYAETVRGPRAWLYRIEGRRLRRLERSLPTWARAVTLVSAAEADLYRSFCEPGPVHAVTNGVDVDGFRPDPAVSESGCVFVGALDYHPNVAGASWFCREVWPEIQRRRPQSRLSLVGRRPTSAVHRLSEVPGVEVVGQVPDVRPHLAAAAVVVVPLRIARGVQNKVLEALAMGKAIVATPEAIAGLNLSPGLHVLSASAPGEWAEAILNLLENSELRQRLGGAGRRHVEDHHRWDACAEPMAGLLSLDPLPLADRHRSLPLSTATSPSQPGIAGSPRRLNQRPDRFPPS